MEVFNLFLEFTSLFLSLTSIVLVYLAIRNCSESEFIPVYYFFGLSTGGVALLSLASIEASLWGNGFILSSEVITDLFLSYVSLFLFGTLWQSYEAEMALPTFLDED